jgi:hypothetical protein
MGRSVEVLAYTAGLFDGEGCVTRGGYKDHRYVLVSISQDSMDVLYWIQAHWGGNVTNSGHGQWKMQGQKAWDFLQEILPYLIVKRAHAELVLAGESKMTLECWEALSAMNGKKRKVA